MDPVDEGHVPKLTPEAFPLFAEGISLLLSQWTALQMAVQNEWGGRDSQKKSEQLAADLLSWFSQSKGTLKFFSWFELNECALIESVLSYFK